MIPLLKAQHFFQQFLLSKLKLRLTSKYSGGTYSLSDMSNFSVLAVRKFLMMRLRKNVVAVGLSVADG